MICDDISTRLLKFRKNICHSERVELPRQTFLKCVQIKVNSLKLKLYNL